MSANSCESPFCTRYASKEMQFLFSADKKFTTGAYIPVSGGRVMPAI